MVPDMKYSIGLVGILLMNFAQAQDTLKPDNIYVIKQYTPILEIDGRKMTDMPQMIKGQEQKMNVQYPVIPKEFQVSFTPDKIAPATMKREALDKIYKGYVKAGVGSYLSTVLDAYYSSTRSSKSMSGFQLNHKGFGGTIKDKGYSGFTNNKIQFFGTKFLDHVQVGGTVGLDYDRVHYYGYDPVFFPDLNKQNSVQNYISPYVNVHLGNTLPSQDSLSNHYRIDLKYRYLQDDFSTREHNSVLIGSYTHPMSKNKLNIDASVDYNTLTQYDSVYTNSFIVGAKPRFVTKLNHFEITVGAGLFMNNVNQKTTLSFKPVADIRVPLFRHILIPYAGIDGDIKRNNFQSFRTQNPFVQSQYLHLDNSDIRYRVYGGLKCAFSSKLQLDVYGQTQLTHQMPLFINDTFGIVNQYFLVIYDNIQTTSLHGELSYFMGKKWNLFFQGDLYSYSTSKESDAWHLPTLKLTATGQYNLYDKWLFRTDLFYMGSRFTKLYGIANGQTIPNKIRVEQLHPYLDLNLSLEYRYTHKVGAFVQALNVLGQCYERFYNYPTQTITVVGGVKILF